jgi:hypothetical protein
MHTLIATAVTLPIDAVFRYDGAPVEDLLLVCLGQGRGSRAPEPRPVALDPADLWDHLGDFA